MYLMRIRLTFAGICLVLAGTPLVAQQPRPSAPTVSHQLPRAYCRLFPAAPGGT